MRQISALLFILISSILPLQAQLGNNQPDNPVRWTYSSRTLSETEVLLTIKAQIESKYHLYSINNDAALPLEFSFEPSANYKLIGAVSENPKPVEKFDEFLDGMTRYFEGQATFSQRIKVLADKDFVLKGSLRGQVCLEDGSCILIEDNFSFRIKGVVLKEDNQEEQQESTNDSIQGADSLSVDSMPVDTITALNSDTTTNTTANESGSNNNSNSDFEGMSLWAFFLAALGGGLLALLTPCIYPMIPMTVTFFMHGEKKRSRSIFEALVYGLSIILIFEILGIIVALLFGEAFAHFVSTHWLPNLIFFVLFIVFAASFLGMFEITLPHWLVNKTDAKADKGGLLGAFFMALTLVLVSFSCTAPIVGSIIAFSAGGEFIKPIVGMLGYALAFALPFTFFAAFPSALKSLPQSGGWLNSVKVILGFIELALSLKFLSMADLNYQWGLLDRDVYLALWIAIFTLMGLYLIGIIRFSHDSELKYLTVPRTILAIITFAFVFYLIPGLFGAPLKALSGWIPPMSTHDFDMHDIVRQNSGGGGASVAYQDAVKGCGKPTYGDQLHLEHGLKGYYVYEEAVACAKAQNKPIFIDFTGHSCANCRKMEEYVWAEPEVLKRLREDYVILALYVDNREIMLPEEKWYVSERDGKEKKMLGEYNFDFQLSKYNANGQPYYVLVDHDGEMLVPPRQFGLDVQAFVDFLDRGKTVFEQKQNNKK